MSELVVREWRRYGRHRLYVNDAAGQRLGWRDEATGIVTVDVPGREADVHAALPPWSGAQSDSQVSRPSTDVPEARPPADDQWAVVIPHIAKDVALHAPGAAARAQADARRAQAPVKTLIARALGVHTDERAWRLGSTGESKVAAELAKLGPAWGLLHAIPVGDRGADIDHLVIGPTGVFTVNAKHHPDANVWVGGSTFIVNGTRVPYVRNSRYEASRAAKLLSAAVGSPVAVRGIIAVVGAARGFTVKSQPKDVEVVARRDIARWIAHRQPVLTPEAVQRLFAVARRSTTWQATG